jgi:hypothetical protein
MGIMDHYHQGVCRPLPKKMFNNIENILKNGIYDGDPPKGDAPKRRKERRDKGTKRVPKKK